MNTYFDAIEVVLRHYRTAKTLCDSAVDRGDVDLSISYAAARSALYDVLLDLVDYDDEALRDLIKSK